MIIERNKNVDINNWYMARMSFITKHGTVAIATGSGNSFGKAIIECLKDYKMILSL